MRDEAFHASLVADFNQLPDDGPLVKRHHYCAHLDQCLTITEQVNRGEIFKENKAHYQKVKNIQHHRMHEFAKNGVWLNIPEYDLLYIKEQNPHIYEKIGDGYVCRDNVGAAKLMKHIYKHNKKYRYA